MPHDKNFLSEAADSVLADLRALRKDADKSKAPKFAMKVDARRKFVNDPVVMKLREMGLTLEDVRNV